MYQVRCIVLTTKSAATHAPSSWILFKLPSTSTETKPAPHANSFLSTTVSRPCTTELMSMELRLTKSRTKCFSDTAHYKPSVTRTQLDYRQHREGCSEASRRSVRQYRLFCHLKSTSKQKRRKQREPFTGSLDSKWRLRSTAWVSRESLNSSRNCSTNTFRLRS
jgi:hypothetical protein